MKNKLYCGVVTTFTVLVLGVLLSGCGGGGGGSSYFNTSDFAGVWEGAFTNAVGSIFSVDVSINTNGKITGGYVTDGYKVEYFQSGELYFTDYNEGLFEGSYQVYGNAPSTVKGKMEKNKQVIEGGYFFDYGAQGGIFKLVKTVSYQQNSWDAF